MYEVHIGEVASIKDPEKRGRVMVKFDNIMDGETFPDWVEPTFPFAGGGCGFFAVPTPGTAVECEVHKGDGGDDSVDTPQIRWRGALYNSVDQIPEEFRGHYPNAIGFKSPGGSLLMFDDEGGAEIVLLKHGKKPKTCLVFDENGSIALMIEVDEVFGSVGITIDALTQQMMLYAPSSIQIISKGAIKLDAASITLFDRAVSPVGGPI
jgi:uncharacterized protein involved in type VI secretion and phage assembly